MRYRLRENVRCSRLWRAVVAESVGTALIVFVGCGSMLVGNYDSYPHYGPMDEPEKAKLFAASKITRVSLAFGLAMAAASWCTLDVSGANLNPAISVALLATGKISLLRAVLYVFAQIVGAIFGIGCLRLALPTDYLDDLGATKLVDGLAPLQGVLIELLATFVVVIVYFASEDRYSVDDNKAHALAIGFAVLATHLFAFPLTRAGTNPARSLAPAIFRFCWRHHWVYWLGPLLGGLIAGLVYCFVFRKPGLKRDETRTTEIPLVITNTGRKQTEDWVPLIHSDEEKPAAVDGGRQSPVTSLKVQDETSDAPPETEIKGSNLEIDRPVSKSENTQPKTDSSLDRSRIDSLSRADSKSRQDIKDTLSQLYPIKLETAPIRSLFAEATPVNATTSDSPDKRNKGPFDSEIQDSKPKSVTIELEPNVKLDDYDGSSDVSSTKVEPSSHLGEISEPVSVLGSSSSNSNHSSSAMSPVEEEAPPFEIGVSHNDAVSPLTLSPRIPHSPLLKSVGLFCEIPKQTSKPGEPIVHIESDLD